MTIIHQSRSAVAKFSSLTTLAACLALAACSAEPEEAVEVEPVDEVVVDPVANAESAAIEICDEDGNRYASEEEAAATGLSEAQYGATYCEYLEE